MRMRALNPNVLTLDRPGEHWRPGVHWGPVVGGATTIRVYLHNGEKQRDYVIAVALLSNTGIGSPVAVRFANEQFSPIVDVQAGEWDGGCGPGPGTAEVDAVARGQFFLGCIPRRITGEDVEKEWTKGSR